VCGKELLHLNQTVVGLNDVIFIKGSQTLECMKEGHSTVRGHARPSFMQVVEYEKEREASTLGAQRGALRKRGTKLLIICLQILQAGKPSKCGKYQSAIS
jgi:hypothetical protein